MDKKIGGMIYSLRKLKGLTQDELGAALLVSGTAVSKWECGKSYPDIEMLCKMADYFQVSADELIGRKVNKVEETDRYCSNKIESLQTASQLMDCYRLSCAEGLLAVEKKADMGGLHPFLYFAVKKVFDFYRKDIPQDKINKLLSNYCKNQNNREIADMIAEAVMAMFEGVSENTMLELIASHLDIEYYDKFISDIKYEDCPMEEILDSYINKEEMVNLLEELADYSDEDIRLILRNIDNMTLVNALKGASGNVCRKFLSNVSDRLLHFIDEDIKNCDISQNEVIEAQKEILKIAVVLNIIKM